MKKQMMKSEEGMSVYESFWHRDLKGKVTKLIAYTPIRHPALSNKKVWSIAVVAPISEVAEAVDKVYIRHFFCRSNADCRHVPVCHAVDDLPAADFCFSKGAGYRAG